MHAVQRLFQCNHGENHVIPFFPEILMIDFENEVKNDFFLIKIKQFFVSRETMYGRMWNFTSDFSRGDTAYTKLALDRHTDTSYFQEPCG